MASDLPPHYQMTEHFGMPSDLQASQRPDLVLQKHHSKTDSARWQEGGLY